jgi:hypothetical protein
VHRPSAGVRDAQTRDDVGVAGQAGDPPVHVSHRDVVVLDVVRRVSITT